MDNIQLSTEEFLKELPDLKFRATAIGTEDLSGTVKNISTYFINSLSKLTSSLNNNLDRLTSEVFIGHNSSTKEIAKNNKLIIDIQANIKFNKVAEILIPSPLGMKENLYKSAVMLHGLKPILTEGMYNIVDEADTVTAKILSSKDYRTSSRVHKVDETTDEAIESLISVLGALIDKSGVKDRMKVKELLPNINSLSEINMKLTELTEAVEPKKFKKLLKSIASIKENVDILHEEYLANTSDIKKERLVELGYYLDNVGRLVTYSISMVHLISQFNDTFKHLLIQLEKNT